MNKLIIPLLLLPFFMSNTFAIVGGELVKSEDRLSLSTVSLSRNGESFCTGTLISRKFILTAAHCVSSKRRFEVSYGEKLVPEQSLRVSSLIVHEAFNPRLMRNFPSRPPHDIALVKLSRPAPKKLKPVDILGTELTRGDELILAGFGLTNFFARSSDKFLRKVKTIFQEKLDTAQEFTFGPTPGKSACKGDSGGPSYFFNDLDELVLVGVTSRGVRGFFDDGGRAIGCTGQGFYTSVLDHREWILENIDEDL